MWGLTAPAAIANLVSILAGNPRLAGVPVLDGLIVSDALASEAVIVGFTSLDDSTAVEGSLTAEGMAAAPDREQYTIRCAVLVSNGDTARLPAARARAYELLSAIGGAVAADRRLGGVVMAARLADATLLQSQTPAGASVTLSFGVAVDAFTTK